MVNIWRTKIVKSSDISALKKYWCIDKFYRYHYIGFIFIKASNVTLSVQIKISVRRYKLKCIIKMIAIPINCIGAQIDLFYDSR